MILPDTDMEYSPEDDGSFSEVKREHGAKNDSKAGEKGDKRGVINRVNRE